MKILRGGVTKPLGFKANGIWCGIKRSGKPDLSLIVCEGPCQAVGVFTKNSVKAAPLLVAEQHLKTGKARAVVINSGNANCFTGEAGYRDAKQMAADTAAALGIKEQEVVVASTGIIGKPMPIDKIRQGIPALVAGRSKKGGAAAARGILTTDTFVKEISARFTVGGREVTIGACAKGSGMIEPNMATMLGFVTTDLAIRLPLLRSALRAATEQSFNCITVDGCMSTNDMVLLMANGQAGNPAITSTGKAYDQFVQALTVVCRDLAKKIVQDGEGATKLIEVVVAGAKTPAMARQVAKQVANSMLVKTAAFGSNPNWGRVAAAVGATGIPVTEKTLKIKFSPFHRKEIRIDVQLKLGTATATVLTTDLSYEYVRINGEYN